MSPSELEILKNKLAEKRLPLAHADMYGLLTISMPIFVEDKRAAFEKGWEAALELGRLLGRASALKEANTYTDNAYAVLIGNQLEAEEALAALTRKLG